MLFAMDSIVQRYKILNFRKSPTSAILRYLLKSGTPNEEFSDRTQSEYKDIIGRFIPIQVDLSLAFQI
jgi:hypothetical protein